MNKHDTAVAAAVAAAAGATTQTAVCVCTQIPLSNPGDFSWCPTMKYQCSKTQDELVISMTIDTQET